MPLGPVPLTHKAIPLDALTLVGSFCAVRLVLPRQRAWVLWAMLLSMTAAHYFWPGVRKVQIGWAFEQDLIDLARAAADNGWRPPLNPRGGRSGRQRGGRRGDARGRAGRHRNPLASARSPSSSSRRRQALHVGIFAASGILFWEWAVLDLALARPGWCSGSVAARGGGRSAGGSSSSRCR